MWGRSWFDRLGSWRDGVEVDDGDWSDLWHVDEALSRT